MSRGRSLAASVRLAGAVLAPSVLAHPGPAQGRLAKAGPLARGLVRSTRVVKPRIVWDPIPFGIRRKQEMAAYVRRHYGSFMKPTWRLVDPHAIVIHYTESPTFQSRYNTFARDTPDTELHELPNTCAHFVTFTDGCGATGSVASARCWARPGG